jgi:hypothetical protein
MLVLLGSVAAVRERHDERKHEHNDHRDEDDEVRDGYLHHADVKVRDGKGG